MSARDALRAATAANHQRVDRLFSGFDLAKSDDYRAFLIAQAAAFLPIEAALDAAGAERVLPDWPLRRRASLLEADLAAMGATTPSPLEAPRFTGDAEILGAIYVLEGSRLGGALLRRALPSCVPNSFLGAVSTKGSWRKLVETLDNFLYGSERIDAATASAKEVFALFEAAACRQSGACAA